MLLLVTSPRPNLLPVFGQKTLPSRRNSLRSAGTTSCTTDRSLWSIARIPHICGQRRGHSLLTGTPCVVLEVVKSFPAETYAFFFIFLFTAISVMPTYPNRKCKCPCIQQIDCNGNWCICLYHPIHCNQRYVNVFHTENEPFRNSRLCRYTPFMQHHPADHRRKC